MSKAVLVAIQPKWCRMIAGGEKIVEVRKNRPKLETPFKCYIYQTKAGKVGTGLFTSDGEIMGRCVKNGTVIGEFVCDSIQCFGVPYPAFQSKMDKTILEQSCLSYDELHRYAYHDALYGWHISNLVIYERPKDLSEFRQCHICEYMGVCNDACWKPLKKAPQNWCYVEEN